MAAFALFAASAPPPPPQPTQRTRSRAAGVAVAGALVGAAAVCGAAGAAVPRPATAPVLGVARKPTQSYWSEMWDSNRLGFHNSDVHNALVKYRAPFLGDAPGRVLVPLCGKTVDLAWLAAQPGVTGVTGVEFVKKAVDDYAKEHPQALLRKAPSPAGRLFKHVLSNGVLTLLCGDIFSLPKTPAYERVWDRAALVALDPAQRQAYVATICQALSPKGKILLQTLTRAAGPAESRAAGPPFSVSEADVAALYGAAFEVRKLEEVDALKSSPKFAAEGLTKVTASTYLLTKK